MKKNKKKILFTFILFTLGIISLLANDNKSVPPSLTSSFKTKENIQFKKIRSPASLIEQEASSSLQEERESPYTDESTDDKALLEKSLAIYKEQGLYRFTTLPLDDQKTENPLRRHYMNRSPWVGSIHGEKLRARFQVFQNFFTNENEAKITLEYNWEGNPTEAKVEASLLTQERETIGPLAFSLDEKNQLSSTIALKELPSGIYLIQAQVSKGSETVYLVKTFSLQKDLPVFQKMSYEKISSEGDLEFSSSWQNSKEGYYLVEAVLSNQEGKAIAAFEQAVYLKKGQQQVPIVFDGYLFFHKKYEGKFQLSQLSLSAIGDSLEIKRGPLLEPHYKTQSYSFQNFRSNPNPDPAIREKIERLEKKISSL